MSYGRAIENEFQPEEEMGSLTRLVGNGLVVEQLQVKKPNSYSGISREAALRELGELITTPPLRRFSRSKFGSELLKFIADEGNRDSVESSLVGISFLSSAP